MAKLIEKLNVMTNFHKDQVKNPGKEALDIFILFR